MTEPRLLGVHGLNDSSRTWAPLTSCGLDINGIDMPWRSASFVSTGYRTFDDLIRPFEAACAQLEGGGFGVIAHSLGASMILRHLARNQHPDAIRFLVLVCPTYVQLKEVGVASTRRLHRQHFDEVFTEGLRLSSSGRDPDLIGRMTQVLVRAISDSERGAVLQLVECTSLSPLESIDLPVLIISGSRDPGFGAERRAELAARLPLSSLQVVDGQGHFGHVKAASTIAPIIRSWIARSVPRRHERTCMMQFALEPVRPLSEGANIESWIGFKHFSYLAEAAAQGYLRATGLSQDQMLNQRSLSVDITELRMRLPSPLYADSVVTARVEGERPAPEELPGKLRIIGIGDHNGTSATCFETSLVFTAWPRQQLDDGLVRAHRVSGTAVGRVDDHAGAHPWEFTIPYPYCRASSVIQFDGYVRLVEETIERLLRDRGISVRRLLVERGWIPVVTGWRINISSPAFMEETLIIRSTTTGVFKSILWDTDITFTILRGGTEVEVARSSITHGYAITRGPDSGQMATFDAEVLAALGGAR